MKHTAEIFTIDAFVGENLRGNPAGVCMLDSPWEEEWMQIVASEMNLSETAFLTPEGEKGIFNLRWFTPTVEVALCGHATLASAHALWETGRLEQSSLAKFQTLSGLLSAKRKEEDWIELVFPIYEVEAEEEEQGASSKVLELSRALLGDIVKPKFIGKFENKTQSTVLVEVGSEAELLQVRPDFSQFSKFDVKMIILTAKAADSKKCDFVERVFAPSLGVNEDPVTGSAQCYLASFWKKRMMGKSEFLVHQVSSRGGVLRLSLEQDKVKISGRAKTVLKGEIQV